MLKRSPATPVPDAPEPTPVLSLKQAPVQLNEGWRVSEDSIQWMLQRRCSKPAKKPNGLAALSAERAKHCSDV